jgi:hypothetical protein
LVIDLVLEVGHRGRISFGHFSFKGHIIVL